VEDKIEEKPKLGVVVGGGMCRASSRADQRKLLQFAGREERGEWGGKEG
jgi:hypothetical protein